MRIRRSNVPLSPRIPATHFRRQFRRVGRFFRFRFRRRFPRQVGRNLGVALVRIINVQPIFVVLFLPVTNPRRRPGFRRLARRPSASRSVVLHGGDVVALLGVVASVAFAFLVNQILEINFKSCNCSYSLEPTGSAPFVARQPDWSRQVQMLGPSPAFPCRHIALSFYQIEPTTMHQFTNLTTSFTHLVSGSLTNLHNRSIHN